MAEETKMEAEAPKTPVAETKTTTTQSTTVAKKGNSKMIIIIVVILLLCCCCSIIAGGYFYFRGASNVCCGLPANILNQVGTPPGFFNPVPNPGSTGSTNDLPSATLPSGFPSDVPIYPGAKILFGVKNDTDSYSASLTSSAASGDVTAFCKSEIVKKGWTIETEGNIFGYVISAKKDTRELNVVVLDIKDDNGNPVQSITLSVTPKN